MAIHYFGWALDQLRAGYRVQRPGWNGKGMWLGLQVPVPQSDMTCTYIYMKTATGGVIPWLASQADMLAGDWEIYGIVKTTATAADHGLGE